MNLSPYTPTVIVGRIILWLQVNYRMIIVLNIILHINWYFPLGRSYFLVHSHHSHQHFSTGGTRTPEGRPTPGVAKEYARRD